MKENFYFVKLNDMVLKKSAWKYVYEWATNVVCIEPAYTAKQLHRWTLISSLLKITMKFRHWL